MKEELVSRVYHLMQSEEVMMALEEHFSGYTGVYDAEYEYSISECVDEVRYSEDKVSAIAAVAIRMAMGNIDYLKSIDVLSELSDDELTILAAFVASRKIEHAENKHSAYYAAEAYAEDDYRVDYYGTKQRAYNKGYDHYMEGHSSFGFGYLNAILEMYEEYRKSQGK